MDRQTSLRYIGYCLAHGVPDEGNQDDSYVTFLNYCKFQLCYATKTLFKDPVWDSYDDEDILTEYFAHTMMLDTEMAKEFMADLRHNHGGGSENLEDWFDKKMRENADEIEEFKKKASGLEEVSFSPDSLGD